MKRFISDALNVIDMQLTSSQEEKFCIFHELLVEWNEKMNLTSILDAQEVAHKHFLDSLLPLKNNLIAQNASCIDIGTGAGFPGIPIMIMRDDIEMVLLDSLAKRLTFLKCVCEKLSLTTKMVHSRAEDGSRTKLRQSFDVVLSRAVAPAAALMELTLPYAKVGGHSICYKGPSAKEEFSQAKNALKILGGGSISFNDFSMPYGERCIVAISKRVETPKQYPRKAGTPAKTPL